MQTISTPVAYRYAVAHFWYAGTVKAGGQVVSLKGRVQRNLTARREIDSAEADRLLALENKVRSKLKEGISALGSSVLLTAPL